MDGLLLDSEPFWKEAETEVFNSIGVPLTNEMCETTVGMRIEEVAEHWYNKYPWNTDEPGKNFADICARVKSGVIERIKKYGVLYPGVNYILSFFKVRNMKMALASSSAMEIINTVVDKFNIRDYFEAIVSAEGEKFGKPHPAIYLNAAQALGAGPDECLAFEDSLNGLRSAFFAGMKHVVIPDSKQFDETWFEIANIKLRRLEDFSAQSLEHLNSL